MQRISLAAGAFAVCVMLLFGAAVAHAESDNEGRGKSLPPGVQALHEQIKKLKEQIEELQKKQKEAMKEFRQSVASTTETERRELKEMRDTARQEIKDMRADVKFIRSLRFGMSGDDVRDLQELLAQDPEVFPAGLITGFFGRLTEEAIKRFQKKHGIEIVGIFGPKTQAKILALFVGRELPPGIIARLGLGVSTTTPGAGVVTICHKPAGASPQTIVIAVPALGAHLAHGDTAGVCPGSTPPPPTPPPADTVAPTISGSAVSGVSSTSATVSWSTNEAATSKVYYGTSSPVDFSTALTMSSASATTSHSLMLSALAASTTYSYALESKDAAGNTATSSTQSFSTTN
ncbi:peptidoglycan-binding protein [Candidatus Kaiserbacteria bacterium]|nr:peptidoglycan-binding protein [Candidatus Kaiserbacteria bacterium]